MSIRAIAWALNVKTGSPTTKLVLIKLADNANDGGACWPSVALVAKQTELSERAVQQHIRRCEELGLLTLQSRCDKADPRQQTTNLYRLNIGAGETLPELADDTPASTVVSEHPGMFHGAQEGVNVLHPPGERPAPGGVNVLHPPGERPAPRTVIEPKPITPIGGDVFLTLPLNTGGEYPITEGLLGQLVPLYPAVDVRQQLRLMRGWLLTNATRRKTQSGVLKFVNNWLSKEQNRGGSHGTNGSTRKPSLAERASEARRQFERHNPT